MSPLVTHSAWLVAPAHMDTKVSSASTESQSWTNIVETARIKELRNPGVINPEIAQNSATLILGYMMLDDLKNAQFAWKRMSEQGKKKFSFVNEIWKLWTFLRKKDRKGFHAFVNGGKWEPPFEAMVQALQDKERTKAIRFIKNSYQSISLVKVADLIGLTGEEAKRKVESLGWRCEKELVYPKKPEVKTGGANEPLDIGDLKMLSEYILQFESK
ncbi:hypothetical protein AAMO2058_000912400 [Amorphochlora amoebiformis]|eukprot:203335-Amorphochlora_amoeboformis.AAC.1